MARISIRIILDEYDSFVRAIPSDDRLPGTYPEWFKRALENDANCIANGEIISEVIVHYEPFSKYCQLTAQQPSYKMLMIYAVALASGLKV